MYEGDDARPEDPGDLVDGSVPIAPTTRGENEVEELTADEILSADDIVEELVRVPEWKTGNRDTVRVRGLTGTERDAFEASIVNNRGKDRLQNLRNVRAKLVYLSLVTPDGSRMFSESQIGQLGSKSAAALNRVWDVAQRLSGITDKEVEELTLGFDDAPSEPSTSG